MLDWQQERDRALLALESAGKAEVRGEAARTLARLVAEDHSRAAELGAYVPRLLDDRDQRVRRAGVALGAVTLPPAEAESFLGKLLSDPAEEVRLEATGQLADLVRPQARGMLALALEDKSPLVRFEAARGMAALHHPAGLEILVEALTQGHLRFRALGALAELGDERALPAVQALFARWLLPAFERTQAAGVMASLGDPAGAAYLFDRARERKWRPDRALAVELLGEVRAQGARERLLEILGDLGDACRGAAARGLGRTGDLALVPVLAGVLEEPEAPEDLLLDAAEGLCLLGGEQARTAVSRAAEAAADEAVRRELLSLLEDYA